MLVRKRTKLRNSRFVHGVLRRETNAVATPDRDAHGFPNDMSLGSFI